MKKSALVSLVAVNLIPVAGVFLLGWDLFSILFFYWLESAVVGVFNIVKMALVSPPPPGAGSKPAEKSKHKLAGIIFFIIHYSGFMAGHGLLIFSLFGPVEILPSVVITGIISLSLSHGISLAVNYIGLKEYQKVTVSEQMAAPYNRIVVMHIGLIACAFLFYLTGAPRLTLVLLVALKIAVDIALHRSEHGSLADA
jgi:hypothetical protein